MTLPILNGVTVDSILDLAASVGELVAGDDGRKFVELGRKVKDLVLEAKDLATSDDGIRLDVARDELDALIVRVNAHADETLGHLKG